MLTPEILGRVLYEEFDRDGWGTVDPWYFQPAPEQDEGVPDYEDVMKVLKRVVERINKMEQQ